MHQMTDDDARLLDLLKSGARIDSPDSASNSYRALVTNILFQFADSELAGASGYVDCIGLGPTLDDRISLTTVVQEKMTIAKRVYALLSEFGINLSKYFVLHTWNARLSRHAELDFRRASSDKRLNALMFPLESWADVGVFTYLMAEMACLQLDDFGTCSYSPFAAVALECRSIEQRHAEFGKQLLAQLGEGGKRRSLTQLSLDYWLPLVSKSFGPSDGEGNRQHRLFKLKTKSNEELRKLWYDRVVGTCRALNFTITGSGTDDASAFH
jgi:1,2-phenylacetyl-CoA epoxidase catalytic subunit